MYSFTKKAVFFVVVLGIVFTPLGPQNIYGAPPLRFYGARIIPERNLLI
jgi:hypothetical protein